MEQHDVSVKRVEQYVKGNRTERRERLTPGAEQICPLCFTVWVCIQLFNSDRFMGLTTHLLSSGLGNETVVRRLFILPETSCGK